jgi:nitrogen fixation/metabolism regulation signal transduction histidine kinase
MRSRALTAVAAAVVASLALPALASAKAGEGLAGELNDKVITFFSLGVLLFFVLVVVVGTIIQNALEKKKDAEKKAKMRQRVGW